MCERDMKSMGDMYRRTERAQSMCSAADRHAVT